MKQEIHIGIVGSGKAAQTLIPQLSKEFLVSVYARNTEAARNLSERHQISVVKSIGELSNCSAIIVAVSDHAIQEVGNAFKHYDGLCMHLSGTQDIDQLSSARRAVMWPIQSLNGAKSNLNQTPFYYETSNSDDAALVVKIIQFLGGEAVKSDQTLRDKMHLCAVLSNNFGNYLFTLCHDLIGSENARHLLPILKESVRSWETEHPETTQTGPAVRQDLRSMEKHLKLLENCPNIIQLYQLISQLIQERHEFVQGET